MLKVVKSLFSVLSLQAIHPKVVYVVRAYWCCTIGCLQVRKFFAQNCVKYGIVPCEMLHCGQQKQLDTPSSGVLTSNQKSREILLVCLCITID